MAVHFSEDGKYYAEISIDGKLKIWNTLSNTFEQEFTPDFHLSSPCTCLHFIETDSLKYKGASSKKKKRKYSGTNFGPYIVLGTTSGLLLAYSVSKANLEYTINSETSQALTCLSSVNHNEVYSGAGQNVFVWNLEKRKFVNQWKVGNERVSAILAIPDVQQIITATKNITLWCVDTKEVLKTFTGHSSEVTLLHFIAPQAKGDSYFISGSKGDRLLNCWNLSDDSEDKNAITSFLMDDIVQNISLRVAADGSTNMAATVRSGVVHIYQHSLNGKCKPLKPKTTIQVVTHAGHLKDIVTPIRIFGATFKDDESLCIGHGTELLLTFENVSIISHKKVQCLVRKDPRSLSASKPDQDSKIITPIVNDDVHYLTSQTSRVSIKREINDGQMEMPMEKRLKNLELNKPDGDSKVPNYNDLAHMLIQGLQSKDKNIIKTALFNNDENVIKNTVRRLPFTALDPLIRELSGYISGRINVSRIGRLWLKHILFIHSNILIANPDLPELLAPIKRTFQIGREILAHCNRSSRKQAITFHKYDSLQETNENDEPLLVYNDKESSDSDQEDWQMDANSESENEWEEDNEEVQIEANQLNSIVDSNDSDEEDVQMEDHSENEMDLEEDNSEEEGEIHIDSELESDSS